jgi:hypothetical protein
MTYIPVGRAPSPADGVFQRSLYVIFTSLLSPLQGESFGMNPSLFYGWGEIDELSSIFFFEFPIFCFKLET